MRQSKGLHKERLKNNLRNLHGTKRLMYIDVSVFLGIAVLIFFAALFLSRLSTTPTYVYYKNSIQPFSWRTVFNVITLLIGFAMPLACVIAAVSLGKKGKKSGETVRKKVTAVLVSGFIGMQLIVYGNMAFIGVQYNETYSSVCYPFTDGIHTLIIEEKSYLLGGSWNAYQLSDDGTVAYLLGSYTTDDGGRNEGNYEIEWSENQAVIHYNGFASDTDMRTAVVQFQE